jgi:uncharacterized membrane protein
MSTSNRSDQKAKVEREFGERETARFEAFSDGVFAIAITLLVLDLAVPSSTTTAPGELGQALLVQWPSYFAFILSFATILITWVAHHAYCRALARVDGLLMFSNGLLLLTVVAFPFATRVLSEYLTTPNGRTAVAAYALLTLINNLSWNLVSFAFKPERRLLRPDAPAATVRTVRRNAALAIPLYLTALGLALINQYVGVAFLTAMWTFWGVMAYRDLNEKVGVR